MDSGNAEAQLMGYLGASVTGRAQVQYLHVPQLLFSTPWWGIGADRRSILVLACRTEHAVLNRHLMRFPASFLAALPMDFNINNSAVLQEEIEIGGNRVVYSKLQSAGLDTRPQLIDLGLPL